MEQGLSIPNKWLVAFTVILPTFIEIMDASVVNVSLPHIQGSLNVGVDEVTWVLTSYLVSNAIIIPITGWLSRVFGRKQYLIISIIIFTLSSLLCGAAPNLGTLVVARILQGLGGGGLQPISQAILLESFPPKERGMAMAVFGMGIVLAPTVGPIVGGWITDSWSWRWIFYINLPIGIMAIVLAALVIVDPPYIKKFKGNVRIDYVGLGLLCIGLGALQIVLDKGEREAWFESDFIVRFAIMAVLGLALFVWWELKKDDPVVDLRIFKDRTYTLGTTMVFLGFFAFFGGIVLLPLYLQHLLNYTAFWAGLVLGPGGLASLIIMPIVGALMKKGVQPKVFVFCGILVQSFALQMMARFNLEADFLSVAFPRVIQAFGLGMFFVPLATASYANIPPEKMGYATGLFNLLRNLAGSFGIAFSTTVLSQRAQFHQNFLVENITPFDKEFQSLVLWLKTHMPLAQIPGLGEKGILAYVYREVLMQANMLAFNDTFFLLSLLVLMVLPLPFFMSTFKPAEQR
jgi:DHA2 family multidrug resistance protein